MTTGNSWFRYSNNAFSQGRSDFRVLSVSVWNEPQSIEVTREIAKGEFDRLVISTGDMASLDFLADCLPGGPKRLMIQGGVKSLAGLEKLINLVDLECDIATSPPYPDFSALRGLKRCWLALGKRPRAKFNLSSLFALPELSDVILRSWPEGDCSEIATLTGLERLDLREGGVSSLDGLHKCEKLRSLSLSYLPNLTDISALSQISALETLHIERCPIVDLQPIEKLSCLRDLHIEKVTGRLHNLSWLSEMPSLSRIRISCAVDEIDWGAVFSHPGLRDVALSSHEGYAMSDSEILQISRNASRAVSNFKRIGKRTLPGFSFDLG